MAVSNPANFEVLKTLSFAAQWQYNSEHSRKDVLSENYFKNSMNRLALGDEIKVVIRNDDGSWSKGIVEVVTQTPTDIHVALMGEWHTAGKSEKRELTSHFQPKSGTWYVKGPEGKIADGLTKDEAQKLVADAA